MSIGERTSTTLSTMTNKWYDIVAKCLVKTLPLGVHIDSPLAQEGDDMAVKIGKSEAEFMVLDILDRDQVVLALGYAKASGRDFMVCAPIDMAGALKGEGLYMYATEEDSGRVFVTNVQLTLVEGMKQHHADEVDYEAALQKSLTVVDVQKSDDQRIVSGIVYEPDTLDAHGDFMTEASIKDMAYYYMEHGKVVGFQHTKDATRDVAILESYLTPYEGVLEGRKIKKGTWMMTVRVNNQKLWNMIKSGKLTGFSFGASAKVIQH